MMLGVPLAQCLDGRCLFGRIGCQGRSPPHQQPGQTGPVLVVDVDKQANVRAGDEIPDPAQRTWGTRVGLASIGV